MYFQFRTYWVRYFKAIIISQHVRYVVGHILIRTCVFRNFFFFTETENRKSVVIKSWKSAMYVCECTENALYNGCWIFIDIKALHLVHKVFTFYCELCIDSIFRSKILEYGYKTLTLWICKFLIPIYLWIYAR